MANDKTKAVVLSRAVTVHVTDDKGVINTHHLPAGRNVVAEHIADHFIVKAHAVDTAAIDDQAVDAKAGKEIATLRAQLAAANERADKAEAKIVELEAINAAFQATAPAANGKK